MKLECTVKGALMPDSHLGYSLPIGGVLVTRDVISPQFIGYDIGCGVCALKLPYKKQEIKEHDNGIFDSIYRTIPTGLGGKNTNHRSKPIEKWDYENLPRSEFLDNIMKNENSIADLASLGSGNHYIEVGYDENEDIWVSIHSGSRSVGHKCATYWMSIASDNGKAKEGHYGLDSGSEDGLLYAMDMNFCLVFALENRKRMMQRIVREITHYCGTKKEPIRWNELINRNHNHAEYNYEMNGFLHRKGATHSDAGMMGVIPANMKDGILIIRGKGNPDSLCSSSHGAGRVLSRTKAKKELNMDRFKHQMKGIIAKVEKSTLDESPNAYKNINEVIKEQSELIDIIHKVTPLINIKGVGGREYKNKSKKTTTRIQMKNLRLY
ncbi:MAG: RtcB family protein [Proteobacteria bacterium]|nr:RtcB family protein [Pseudomonadota bacterium]